MKDSLMLLFATDKYVIYKVPHGYVISHKEENTTLTERRAIDFYNELQHLCNVIEDDEILNMAIDKLCLVYVRRLV